MDDSVQPISDDQELAKVLAGVTAAADGTTGTSTDGGVSTNSGLSLDDSINPSTTFPNTTNSEDSTNNSVDSATTADSTPASADDSADSADSNVLTIPSSSDDPSTDFTPPTMPDLSNLGSDNTGSSASNRSSSSFSSTAPRDLDSVKKDAIIELRPLVDKLNISPEEKFDTYLLLIRATDDKALIAPAHEAAKAIPDESRRAQALFDVIKEIDYLSNNS